MEKVIFLFVLSTLVLTACIAKGPVLAPEMVAALNVYADRYDLEYPNSAEVNIARLCAAEPSALYWYEESQRWAVVCLLSSSETYGDTYGAVMLDASHQVIHTEHINVLSLKALDALLASVGWEKR